MKSRLSSTSLILFFFLFGLMSAFAQPVPELKTWQVHEITLQATGNYENPYTEVTTWVDLEGPEFFKRVYGFWDGENTFKYRVVATNPGKWRWTSGSNQPEDEGLNNHSGQFQAEAWSETEIQANPVRRGFIRSTPNGHALQYADGTPFFMVGDTWLAGATWRLPFRNAEPPSDYEPGPGMGFEDAVQYRKKQGFNSVSMIAAFPNWESDVNPSTYADSNGIYLRNAWEKFGYDVADGPGVDASGGDSYWGTLTAKNMRDEYGHLPFKMSEEHENVSDFNRITPEYFQSLDKKMTYLSEQGMVPLLETVRRDVGPSWDAYFDFNESFARYVQYLISRYGAYNFLFSTIHLDWIPDDFSLTAEQFNEALTYHLETYGSMPFDQPVTVLIDSTTYGAFGHGEKVPWLTMHSVGNKPRDHRVNHSLKTIFELEPQYPAINFEPYYTGWDHEINKPGGERPPANSDRDNYFARAQMYGSVLSGGLSGHVHGTAAYDITTTGEPEGARPHIWDAFKYESAMYMRHLETFMLSEGDAYQQLELARDAITPNKAPDAPADGLDGWAYMMRTPDKTLAFLYFENASVLPSLQEFTPGEKYHFKWFDTMTGEWLSDDDAILIADDNGQLGLPEFPGGEEKSSRDWAAKITLID
ncbi:DUF5060 domain-containing protein [Gracilimonas mengyeensis]|uniref:Collagen-binding domain of a collagenase n=1 Tax=Gracilimonas mengyeensis TaxID=1302730 RepID=A0A521ES59_9BACT|nr:DUF5060 domain-containing protein [Gracilimonas mengyeensis]SMO86764.1 protein of unknown function [Gracilimonas mengyeensis]